jgi:hypothetical protein
MEPILDYPHVFGHGTHVFALDQYKVLLAMRAYGTARLAMQDGAVRDVPASLEDVTPTVLDALDLDLDSSSSFDGRSLVPYLSGAIPPESFQRIRFIETEFNPPGLDFVEISSLGAFTDAAKSYRIDPDTDRVLIRLEKLGEILRRRQYAALLGDRMLAAIPTNDSEQQHLLYVENSNGDWRWLDDAPDGSSSIEEQLLWNSLTQRFKPVQQRPIVPLVRGN